MEEYLKLVHMFRDYTDASQDPVFSEVVTLDLATVVSSVSGPKRPHDRVPVVDMPTDFRQCLTNKVRLRQFFSVLLPSEWKYIPQKSSKIQDEGNIR
jgi:aconitate hydratase